MPDTSQLTAKGNPFSTAAADAESVSTGVAFSPGVGLQQQQPNFKTSTTIHVPSANSEPSSLTMESLFQNLPDFHQPQPPPSTHSQRHTPLYAGAPKKELHALYGAIPRRTVISAENYHSWHNSGEPHQLLWTSIFCCPMTGELFVSGRYHGATSTVDPTNSSKIQWYTKKAHAEHGAAARAFDCAHYRDQAASAGGNGVGLAVGRPTIGLDEPYLGNQAVFALGPESGVPDHVVRAVQRQQAALRAFHQRNG